MKLEMDKGNFQLGMKIVIDQGAKQEENEVIGFGSLLLKSPLKNDHSADCSVVGKVDAAAAPPPAGAAMLNSTSPQKSLEPNESDAPLFTNVPQQPQVVDGFELKHEGERCTSKANPSEESLVTQDGHCKEGNGKTIAECIACVTGNDKCSSDVVSWQADEDTHFCMCVTVGDVCLGREEHAQYETWRRIGTSPAPKAENKTEIEIDGEDLLYPVDWRTTLQLQPRIPTYHVPHTIPPHTHTTTEHTEYRILHTHTAYTTASRMHVSHTAYSPVPE